ncbi:sporulation integral membrane protein YlbJ [Caloranaerobacter sp. DY30410]|uniref:sporulation integral membrane protein YlbJ n=1 Tax=Caloranaerobacter sp. DY30410 TaxID=3238305 RepID=UPI003D0432A2
MTQILSILFLILIFFSIKKSKYLLTILPALITIFIILSLIIFPKNTINAAIDGINIWFYIVLPSLLPFFISAEVLIGLGVVNFIGTLLGPIMKPIFNLPGEAAFPFAMSITSGYPVGVKLTSKLRSQGVLTRIEAQRLVSFASTSGPLFMIGAVAVGMLKMPNLGLLIAIPHYLGAITVGLFFRYYGIKFDTPKIIKNNKKNLIKTAFNELILARKKDNRGFGLILGDAVKESFNTMLIIGGFIILYSVIIEILNVTGIINLLSSIISFIPFISNKELIKAFISGLIEMTVGCKNIANIPSVPILVKLVTINFIIAWSGISIHSQASSFISKTDLKVSIYLLSKLLHGIFASIYTVLISSIFIKLPIDTPVYASYTYTNTVSFEKWFNIFKFSTILQISILLVIILISLITSLLFIKSKK